MTSVIFIDWKIIDGFLDLNANNNRRISISIIEQTSANFGSIISLQMRFHLIPRQPSEFLRFCSYFKSPRVFEKGGKEEEFAASEGLSFRGLERVAVLVEANRGVAEDKHFLGLKGGAE